MRLLQSILTLFLILYNIYLTPCFYFLPLCPKWRIKELAKYTNIEKQNKCISSRDLSLQAVKDVSYGTSLSRGILSTLVQRAFNRDPEIRGNCCMSKSCGMLRECRLTPGTFRGCWNIGAEAVMDVNGAQPGFQIYERERNHLVFQFAWHCLE